ncbi:hypothetical protein [Paracoccus versutus]|uniref:hypothetical protein n=1 Tax=Paracoccus versutus TaxID=34007 RepID=UPI000DF7A600|nr:hypothetical protein [Paracoccus versutus]RDD69241.1 hypothetical protein DVR11_22740 [Paracoccus versutus]
MASLPSALYLIIRDHGDVLTMSADGKAEWRHIGLGSPDVTDDFDAAYDEFTDAVETGDPVAVIRLDTIGSMVVGAKDVTDQFEHEAQEIAAERSLDMPDVRRFEMSFPQPIAAE